MPYDPSIHRGGLRRLSDEAYRGRVWVHWVLTLKDRRTGWLSEASHHAFREVLLHVAARYEFTVPVYCLIPDHAHLVWGGVSEDCDQRLAMAFFRRHWNAVLREAGYELQRQAYDHVFRDEEVRQDAFKELVAYVLENPVRAERVTKQAEWSYSGAMIPGRPGWSPFQEGYWDSFWRAYGEVG